MGGVEGGCFTALWGFLLRVDGRVHCGVDGWAIFDAWDFGRLWDDMVGVALFGRL